MESILPRDLNSIKAEFESWRAQRRGRERIPEQLWNLAIALLDYYPFHKVRKELNLNAKQLKERSGGKVAKQQSNGRAAKQNFRSKQAFLEVSSGSLTKALPPSNNAELSNGSVQTCRVVFERVDGSRLSLNLPVEWNHIQSICHNFLSS